LLRVRRTTDVEAIAVVRDVTIARGRSTFGVRRFAVIRRAIVADAVAGFLEVAIPSGTATQRGALHIHGTSRRRAGAGFFQIARARRGLTHR
jgi:hypothetical protein